MELTEGFRLLFVQCTPVEGEELITKVKEDLPKKTIEVLQFEEPIDNLYEIVKDLPNREQVNILFIQGLEHSLYEYEQTKFGEKSERFAYSWKGVPKILNHLNLQGRILDVSEEYQAALKAFDKAIEMKPDYHQAWASRGNMLRELGRLKEAIAAFDKAIEIKPDYYQAWKKRGYVMYSLERYEDAIASFDKVLQIKPHNYQVWNNRGYLLLKKYSSEGMTVVYNKPLEINRNLCYEQFSTKELEILKEALDNFNKSIEQQPFQELIHNA
ncbi:tetratricopeptide repeat protein [Rivularia sp. PCC 7116]|uniref:tetratricopeptide repeat protein n=1 Tax=Rivularia sp. PCC 7116 TaxID=373994 RepID=UPI00029F3B9E|nr:tetratricopeptide repeat protein [Rivularia sp. PCC 7116]AFY53552.1 tetratricopeptide repeat protein [Rivularia sp. PCC 7116]